MSRAQRADRATFFRFDLAYAQNPAIGTNPHEFLAEAGSAIALQGKGQIATFLASDGQVTIDPDGRDRSLRRRSRPCPRRFATSRSSCPVRDALATRDRS